MRFAMRICKEKKLIGFYTFQLTAFIIIEIEDFNNNKKIEKISTFDQIEICLLGNLVKLNLW